MMKTNGKYNKNNKIGFTLYKSYNKMYTLTDLQYFSHI